MPTTSITSDHETEQRTAIIRTPDHAIRVTEHVDGPATCSLVPVNPRQRCTPYGTPYPMTFDEAVGFIEQCLTPFIDYPTYSPRTSWAELAALR